MRAGAAPSTQCDVQRQRVTRPLVTCEHGGNRIPSRYAALFVGRQRLLASHRGHDPGALAMARSLSRAIGAPLVAATISRLLVELNRSPGRQFRFSPIMRTAPAALRAEVCRRYYLPYWSAVESFVDQARANGERVVHVSSHSFTPSLDGSMLRNADIGLLYDSGARVRTGVVHPLAGRAPRETSALGRAPQLPVSWPKRRADALPAAALRLGDVLRHRNRGQSEART